MNRVPFGLCLAIASALLVAEGCSDRSSDRDKVDPTISIETPTTAPTYRASSTPIVLGGTASDNRAVESVTWSNADTGGSGTATGTTTWTATVPLNQGSNQITVTAADRAGNFANDTITVTMDDVPPQVSIETPTTATTYGTVTTPIPLGGIASDNDTVAAVTWSNPATGGSGTASGTTAWTADVPLAMGSNPITVTAEDPTGLTATDSITVTLSAGEVYAWGSGANGQLGDGTAPISNVPVQVVDPSDTSGFLQGAAGVAAGTYHTVAVMTDGTVRAWGANSAGQLGDGTNTDRETPVQVRDPADISTFLNGVVAVSAGRSHTVALLSDGTVRTWGSNWDGELGDGTMAGSFTPVQVVEPTDLSGYLTGVAGIATGWSHTVAVKTNGEVWAWGSNSAGQLGDGTTVNSPMAIQVTDPGDLSGFLQGIVSVGAGDSHSVASVGDGSARAWGSNFNGQLGDGTTTGSLTPVQVIDPPHLTGYLYEVASVAAAGSHSYAVLNDGTVRSWGNNIDGQLGDGTTTDRDTPVKVIDPADLSGDLTTITAAATGHGHVLALRGDTLLKAWGWNRYGQLGNGANLDRTLPDWVIDPPPPTSYLTGVTAIAAGREHSAAVLSDGTVRTWGRNWFGQLGDGTARQRTEPGRVIDPSDPTGYLTEVVEIAAGTYHTVGRKEDRTLRAWGLNDAGQIGDGTTIPRWTPAQVIDPSDPTGFLTAVTVVTAGGFGHTVALLSDGTVRAWGSNAYGQIGDGGIMVTSVPTPVQVVDPSDPTGYLQGVVALAAGGDHTIALKGDGTVWGWGRNNYGQLGNGTTLGSSTLTAVVDPTDPSGLLTGVVAIAAGTWYHTVALKANGTVRAWGWNNYGQLGDGTTTGSMIPVQVIDPSDPTGFLTGVTAIGAGGQHVVALLSDGTLRAWGWNTYGQLGDGGTTDSSEPIQVTDPTDPSGFLTSVTTPLACGMGHSIALISDGTVRTWGSNRYGELGDGTTTGRRTPVRVIDPSDPTGFLTGVTSIAAGTYHSVALK